MNCGLTNEFERNLRSNEHYLNSRGFGWTRKGAANQSQTIERQKNTSFDYNDKWLKTESQTQKHMNLAYGFAHKGVLCGLVSRALDGKNQMVLGAKL